MPRKSATWFQDPIFNRYWQHYYGTLDWFHHHKQIMYEIEHQASRSEPPGYSTPPRYTHHHRHSGQASPNSKLKKQNCSVKRKRRLSEPCPLDVEATRDTSDGLEMEVTEEIIAFFQHSEKHRQELKAARMAKKEAEEKAGSTGKDKGRLGGMVALSEQRRRRTAEMKELYGSSAAMVHGMETAMQLSFDRFCDLQQPRHWPNIPLKL
ncbi:gem-associated protein 8-like [Ornithodoros turicata]|uniref:gem-associated protein 8-like n=1 Tax=Ornithodoros turicata TaxID=34597 RepID=UPI00313A2107